MYITVVKEWVLGEGGWGDRIIIASRCYITLDLRVTSFSKYLSSTILHSIAVYRMNKAYVVPTFIGFIVQWGELHYTQYT